MSELALADALMLTAWLVVGYLSGSVPYGLLLTCLAGLGDVRSLGSGNIGATNVLRTGSKPVAAATLVCDALKGTLPVLVALSLHGPLAGMAAGLGAFLGHVLPLWLTFRGGKGVATYLGVLFALSWPLGFVFIGTWLAIAFLFRYSSLSALVAAAAVPVIALATGQARLGLFLALLGVMIVLTHRQNIARLLRGEESRIKLRASSAA